MTAFLHHCLSFSARYRERLDRKKEAVYMCDFNREKKREGIPLGAPLYAVEYHGTAMLAHVFSSTVILCGALLRLLGSLSVHKLRIRPRACSELLCT